MKILHVVGAASRQTGSFERHLLALADAGADRGMRLALCYPEPLPDGAYAREVAARGIEVAVVASRGRLDPFGLRALQRLARDADLVHGHFEPQAYQAALAARLAGRSSILTRHYLAPNARRSMHARQTVVSSRIAEAMVAVSEPVREGLLAYGVDAARVRTVPLGIDRARFSPAPQAPARERLGVGDGFVVACTSHHRPGKGIETLIAAAAAMRAPVHVLIAGDGPLRSTLQDLAARLRAPVRFLGVLDDVRTLLHAADAFVLPTDGYPEGLPMATLEAMACGLPVLVTPVPALLDIVPPEGIVPAGDPAALAAALDRLAGEQVVRAHAREASLRAVERFDLDTCVDGLLGLYEEVACVRSG